MRVKMPKEMQCSKSDEIDREKEKSEKAVMLCPACQTKRCIFCGYDHHPGQECRIHYLNTYVSKDSHLMQWIK